MGRRQQREADVLQLLSWGTLVGAVYEASTIDPNHDKLIMSIKQGAQMQLCCATLRSPYADSDSCQSSTTTSTGGSAITVVALLECTERLAA